MSSSSATLQVPGTLLEAQITASPPYDSEIQSSRDPADNFSPASDAEIQILRNAMNEFCNPSRGVRAQRPYRPSNGSAAAVAIVSSPEQEVESQREDLPRSPANLNSLVNPGRYSVVHCYPGFTKQTQTSILRRNLSLRKANYEVLELAFAGYSGIPVNT
ncbi:hypothetical protein B0A55_09911 [Friedmanniomyces simplex]|uniref:Uncharacterized protein n=1 Tax=Friedmanniomyces simplex TaxID=329884 RepID=A0A4U0XLY7_9PEZI|nr:hypothetical protein B0A55_09911 [Friedmanniomyces simplex]